MKYIPDCCKQARQSKAVTVLDVTHEKLMKCKNPCCTGKYETNQDHSKNQGAVKARLDADRTAKPLTSIKVGLGPDDTLYGPPYPLIDPLYVLARFSSQWSIL